MDIKPRCRRELQTITVMISRYCRDHHSTQVPCPACASLLTYASERLTHCPFGEGKPTCNRCPVHCYRPQMRQRVKEVMRYSGPKMFWRHPVLGLLHLCHGFKKIPDLPKITRQQYTTAKHEGKT